MKNLEQTTDSSLMPHFSVWLSGMESNGSQVRTRSLRMFKQNIKFYKNKDFQSKFSQKLSWFKDLGLIHIIPSLFQNESSLKNIRA